MKNLKAKDLRDKTVEELKAMEQELRVAQYKLRRDLVFRQVLDTSSVKTQRHNIARIKTVINEKTKSEGK